MENITYVGEWTLASNLGQAMIAMGFVAALLGFIGYLKGSLGDGDAGWLKFGRRAFIVHGVLFFAVIALIFALIANHRYEFQYVWKHLNNAMPMRYIFSCFWGGQEGGFLLWMFWHIVLGFLLIRKKGKWEGPVMTIFSAVQASLACMLLGVYFGDYQFGLDPFQLLRNEPDNIGLPWTKNADYLTAFKQFQDGRGLNPLLQNYWMTIHPPTLFLGFASTLVPFAFAIAGLWKRDFTGWIKQALPWTFFGVMILGTGILMGGAWAYEALSFGGFWAWDPVENSSLVPWIVLVAGAHLMLINNRKPTALFSMFLLLTLSFVLVVYSTFLTKSGILGDSSVHSFVDSGILPQLLVYLLLFVGVMSAMFNKNIKQRFMYAAANLILLVVGCFWEPMVMILIFIVPSKLMVLAGYRNNIPRLKKEEEEDLWSREFWMFIGSLILLVAAVHITWQTSVPVFNHFLEPFSGIFLSLNESTGLDIFKALSEHNYAPGKDIDRTYHLIQVPLAFLILMLVAGTQFLKYKTSNIRDVLAKIARPFLVSALLMIPALMAFDFSADEFPRIALLFSAIFGFTANIDYIIAMLKGKFDSDGASIADAGFALILLGALISTSQKDIISQNQIGDISSLNEELKNNEDILLLEGDTLSMDPYFISYRDRYEEGIHVKFRMDYFDRIPYQYNVGDIVILNGMMFECTAAHQAGKSILEHLENNWRQIPIPNQRQMNAAKLWVNAEPGEYLFTLEPRIQMNEQMGNAPEPDTKHYWNRDLYTHIKWGRITPPPSDEDGYLDGRAHDVHVGDSLLVSNILVKIDSLGVVDSTEIEKFMLLQGDMALKVHLTLQHQGRRESITPLYIIRQNIIVPDLVTLDDWGLKFLVNKFDPTNTTINLSIWEHESIRKDFVVMQAIIFPQINILWIGIFVMIIGSIMAIRRRLKQNRKKA